MKTITYEEICKHIDIDPEKFFHMILNYSDLFEGRKISPDMEYPDTPETWAEVARTLSCELSFNHDESQAMPEHLTKNLRLMIAMADFISNCSFDVDMKESTQEMGEFFFEKLTEFHDYFEEEERKKLSGAQK